ncbi:MAG: LuxR C-terminal-related transcriptional regulator [Planctomycetaceae bacterium]|nr:LuxR C-terminal-related transcriptional regulator [Planctomycetaceae bacterium]
MATKKRLVLQRELTGQLVRAIDGNALTVVVAPVGYGKTTIAHTLAGRTAGVELFIDVQPGTRSLGQLWASLIEQVGKISTALPVGMKSELPPATPTRAARLLAQITPDARPVVLVFDNYHHIEELEADTFMERLARIAFPDLRLVLFSRKWPKMRLDDLVADNVAALFDKRSLKFSDAETREYFAMHGATRNHRAHQIWQNSDGWPAYAWAAVQDWRASEMGQQPPDLDSLLRKALLSVYSDDEQTLLMRLSILEDFSASEAEALAGMVGDTVSVTDFLARDPIVIMNEETGRYALNPFTRRFLRREMASTIDIEPSALRRVGAECMAARGDTASAFRLFMETGVDADVGQALDLFLAPNAGVVRADAVLPIHAAIESIPWTVTCRHALGAIATLWFRLLSGMDAEKIARLAEDAEYRFAIAKDLSPDAARRIRGELALLQGCLSVRDMLVMRRNFRTARRLLAGPSSMRHWLRVWGGCFPSLSFFLLNDSGTHRKLTGRFQAVAETLNFFAGGGFGEMAAACRGEYYLEQGRFDSALASFTRDIAGDDTAVPSPARFGVARLLCARGRWRQAVGLLDDLRLRPSTPSVRPDYHDVLLGYVYAVSGYPDSVPERVRALANRAPSCEHTPGCVLSYIVHGKILLAEGEYVQLGLLARTMPLLFGSRLSLLGRIHAKILESICAWHLAGTREGVERFGEVISLSRPDGLILSIAEYGGYVTPLVQALLERYPRDIYLLRIAALAKSIRRNGVDGIDLSKALSHRERDVMRLVSTGMSNKAIGDALGISNETVKKHLSAIYGKLDVSNRPQAVRQFTIRYGSEYHGRQ